MLLYIFTRTASFDKGLKMSVKSKHNNIVILLFINRTVHPITIRCEYCKLNLILSYLWNATLQQVYKCLKHSRRLTPSSNIKAKPFFNLINLTESRAPSQERIIQLSEEKMKPPNYYYHMVCFHNEIQR